MPIKKKNIPEAPEEKAESGLNITQELFCKLYVSKEFYGNGVQSYIEAYKPDDTKPNWYKTACATSSEILTNPKVCARINDLLEEGGMNDQFMDKQLVFLATQHDDKGSKLGAIREYNKLKQRITEKVEHSGSISSAITWTDIKAKKPIL